MKKTLIILLVTLAIMAVSCAEKRTPKQKQEDANMANIIATAHRGDLILLKDYEFAEIVMVTSDNNELRIAYYKLGWQWPTSEGISTAIFARHSKKLIRKSDKDYPEYALKFVNQFK